MHEVAAPCSGAWGELCCVWHCYCVAGCSSCLNGGTCVDGINRYTCRCPDKFVGANCQTPLWPCDLQPCLNGGTCSNNSTYSSLMSLTANISMAFSAAFHCHCPIGFTGPRCEYVIDWCHGSNVPCRNGATCRQVGRQFECLCAAGWTGIICDVKNVSCTVAAALGEFTVPRTMFSQLICLSSPFA